MLAAYARATAPRPTPAPMPAVDPALSAGCFEWASAALMTVAPYMPTKTDFGAALRGLQDGCQAAARDKGAIGVSCFENGANQWLVGNALYGGVNASFIDAYYRLCAGALAL